MRKPVSLLITDLDNTIFDWFSPWYHSFKVFSEQLSTQSGIPMDVLLTDFKAIHQKHGTAEYAFAVDELPCLISAFPGEDLVRKFKGPIDAYKEETRKHLAVYPGVVASLDRIRKSGCTIVAYTESMDLYTAFRIGFLGLDGVLDYVFTSPNHDVPAGYGPRKINSYTTKSTTLKKTKHLTTPEGEKKPNPHILLDIIDQVGGLPAWTVYVGDSLWKDVHMAQQANIYDCHAAYGVVHLKEEYDLLKQVTHWTDEDVRIEATTDPSKISPSAILEYSFDEIFKYIDFVKAGSEGAAEFEALVSNQVELWKQTVTVQMHFNEIEMKIRNLALTFVGIAVSAAGLSLKEKMTVNVFGGDYPLAALLCVGTAIVLLSFWFMDRLWYHRLLYGSVKHGIDIEERLSSYGMVAKLTKAIGDESPVDVGTKRFHSKAKISFFYFSLSAVLSIAGCFLLSSKIGLTASGLWILMAVTFYIRQPSKEADISTTKNVDREKGELMKAGYELNAILITVLALIMMPIYSDSEPFDVWDMSLAFVATVFGINFLRQENVIGWFSAILASLISGVAICLFFASAWSIWKDQNIHRWLEEPLFLGLPGLFVFCAIMSGIIWAVRRFK